MTPDLINGLFELSAAGFLSLSVRRVLKDHAVKGVSPIATAFFFLWGVWNVYFYPSQGLTWSFAGGVAVVIVNLVYLIALLCFSERQNKRRQFTRDVEAGMQRCRRAGKHHYHFPQSIWCDCLR